MTSGNEWRAEKAARRVLSALNRMTNAAYGRCESNGGHQRSGEYVYRDLLSIPVCAKCHVPIRSGRGFGNPVVRSAARKRRTTE